MYLIFYTFSVFEAINEHVEELLNSGVADNDCVYQVCFVAAVLPACFQL